MPVCTYDNPATMRRECWQNGELLVAYDAVLMAYPESVPARYFFFGASIGPWHTGQWRGNPEAVPVEYRPTPSYNESRVSGDHNG